ncbi:G-type lectin S-receptor-like serine/threonine-protein kinase At4g27290 isoform X1 [Olea europaea var. sylvestris]|uniref:G-type lectin S-receptor-like serine/threonine-protein kinase At4g27290 isoform X1 n=1 Tax=Olea europaea var. sylvestris TaxID=158386 RepID=UPI000C1D3639|nr:G-type lectin S-receptor-like serine/threonine-protein kinase At4g27290 isoform X1 [Olea europaea var. sylvestris]
MKFSNKVFSLLFAFTFILSIHEISNAIDTITTTQTLRDGKTIVSSDGTFELGFFSPGNSKNRYVGMWYKKITDMKVVWVANREVPLTNTSGVLLKVVEPGLLVLQNDSNGVVIWSSNTSRHVKSPVAKLLDSGNLVVKDTNDDDPKKFLWESFNYPTDTMFSGMKLGWSFKTDHEVYLSSWKSKDDSSTGVFTCHFDPTGYPQQVLKKGLMVIYKTGPWNGVRYSGSLILRKDPIFKYGVVLNKNEAYYYFDVLDRSIVSTYTLMANGATETIWVTPTYVWVTNSIAGADICDIYGFCGAYGSCNIANSPVCGCFDKFLPKDPDGWNRKNWSNGCIRRTPLNCLDGDVFLKYIGIKLPDTQYSRINESMTLEECKVVCLKNCTCMAYTNLDITRGGSGCLLWFKELINIKILSEAGQDIYIRMSSFELDKNINELAVHSEGKRRKILITSLTSLMGVVLLGLSLMLYFWKRKKNVPKGRKGGSIIKDFELPLFDLPTISKATNNFSINNKLGQGGYGLVYKGTLEDGEDIAVKRLSETSMQGLDEFMNEVMCIAKLQHRNLVKLLGCCIQGEEKMLVYEYMPNKSLDFILFDQAKSRLLDWPKRFHIINGVARGLLYLHQDSRMRIIHRDLKASNILLDADMNPRISDFGLAKSFGGNEAKAKTSRVVGTHGYMSPEYVVDGLFSLKSDVFSFGVLVLEIVSGRKNWGFSHSDHRFNLLGHAWILYKEGRSQEVVGTCSDDSEYFNEVLRSIHVGLLCVQKCPGDRPRMSTVVFMLENDGALPEAKQPGFFTEREVFPAESSTSTNAAISSCKMSITLPEGR